MSWTMIALIAAAIFAVAGVGVSLLELWFAPKLAPAQAPPVTPPTTGTTPATGTQDIPKTTSHDEPPDQWEKFGFADDSPNLFRAVVTGRSGTGRILYYLDSDVPRKHNWAIRTIERVSGKHYFGTPLITSLRSMSIDRVIRSQTQTSNPDSPLIEQLQATGLVKRRGLRKRIYRPTYHSALDTKDGVRFNVNSYVVFRVRNPEKAFTVYQDSFLQTLSELDGAFMSSQSLKLDWDDYKKLQYSAASKFDLTSLNKILASVDCEVETYYVSDPEIVKQSPEVQAALEKVLIARETAKAKREEGQGERDYKITVAEGEAKAIERLAKAQAARFDELYKSYRTKTSSDAEAIRMAQERIITEFNADAIGNLTNYMVGTPGGVQLSVPGTGDKKK